MAATNWTPDTVNPTNWSDATLIPLLGVLMGDPVYTMGSSVATMGDFQYSPNYGAPTNWTPENV